VKTKLEAFRAARKLQALMKGKGWKIRVWENSGWHAAVETKRVAVYYHEGELAPYMCLMKPHYAGFGKVQHGKNPNLLVRRTIQNAAKAVAADYQIIIEANSIYEH